MVDLARPDRAIQHCIAPANNSSGWAEAPSAPKNAAGHIDFVNVKAEKLARAKPPQHRELEQVREGKLDLCQFRQMQDVNQRPQPDWQPGVDGPFLHDQRQRRGPHRGP